MTSVMSRLCSFLPSTFSCPKVRSVCIQKSRMGAFHFFFFFRKELTTCGETLRPLPVRPKTARTVHVLKQAAQTSFTLHTVLQSKCHPLGLISLQSCRAKHNFSFIFRILKSCRAHRADIPKKMFELLMYQVPGMYQSDREYKLLFNRHNKYQSVSYFRSD